MATSFPETKGTLAHPRPRSLAEPEAMRLFCGRQVRSRRYTVPRPFRFEHRASLPAKPIMAAKLDAELTLRDQAESTANNVGIVDLASATNARSRVSSDGMSRGMQHLFRARHLPPGTLEPRYAAMTAEQELARQSNKQSTRDWHKVCMQTCGAR